MPDGLGASRAAVIISPIHAAEITSERSRPHAPTAMGSTRGEKISGTSFGYIRGKIPEGSEDCHRQLLKNWALTVLQTEGIKSLDLCPHKRPRFSVYRLFEVFYVCREALLTGMFSSLFLGGTEFADSAV